MPRHNLGKKSSGWTIPAQWFPGAAAKAKR